MDPEEDEAQRRLAELALAQLGAPVSPAGRQSLSDELFRGAERRAASAPPAAVAPAPPAPAAEGPSPWQAQNEQISQIMASPDFEEEVQRELAAEEVADLAARELRGGSLGALREPAPAPPIATRDPDGTVRQVRGLTPNEAAEVAFRQESTRSIAPDTPSTVMQWVGALSSITGIPMDMERARRIAAGQGRPLDAMLSDAVAYINGGSNAVQHAQAARDLVGLQAAEQARARTAEPLVTGSGGEAPAGAQPIATQGGLGLQPYTGGGGAPRPPLPPVGAPDAQGMRDAAALARMDALGTGESLDQVGERTRDEADRMRAEVDALDAEHRDREEAARQGVNEASRKFEELNASIRSRTIDPDRWFKDRGTSGKILAVASLAMGSLAGIFKRDGENPVLQMVEQEIARDLDAQERDLGRAERADDAERRGNEQLLYHHFRMLGDVRAAREAAMGTAYRSFAGQLQALAQQSGDEVRSGQLLQQADQFLMAAEQSDHRARTQLATIEAQRRPRGGGGGGGGFVARINVGTDENPIWVPVKRTEALAMRGTGALGGAGGAGDGQRDRPTQRFLAPRISATRTGLERVAELRRMIDASGSDDVPGVSRARSIAGLVGGETTSQLITTFTSEEGQQIQNALGDLVAQVVKARSGAQATDAEYRRLYGLVAGHGSARELRRNLDRAEAELRGTARSLYDMDPEQARLAGAERFADFQPLNQSSMFGQFVSVDEQLAAAAERQAAARPGEDD